MKFFLYFAIFLLEIFTHIKYSYCQNAYDKWYFGTAAVDFSGGAPVAITSSAMGPSEGCSSIADAAGNLLFYTDGRNVFNANNVIMPNGSGLLAAFSATQGALIVKHPGNANQYYIFTVGDLTSGAPTTCMCFAYSIVDMTLQGGLGDITATKNVLLLNNTTEKLAAIKAANRVDVWIIVHQYNNSDYYAYLLNSSGAISQPVISSGSPYTISDDYIGQLKFSPSCDKIAAVLYTSCKVEICDFDNATGIISNPILSPVVATSSELYGLEFSPDGSKLYVSSQTTFFGGSNGYIYQYNLNAGSSTALFASKTIVSNYNTDYLAAMQVAPDNKIYISQHNLGYLHVINDPNNLGVACNYQDSAIYLNGKTGKYGMPAFVTICNNSTPLPIELLSFTGKNFNDKNVLRWSTASEINNDYFTLEKSVDAIGYQPITHIDGAGNSTTVLNYYFTDESPSLGINYYRLKQTDYDGVYSYSNTIALHSNTKKHADFVIYPNPTSNILNIELNNIQTLQIKITNILGSEIFTTQIHNSLNTIDVSGLSNGIYYITSIMDIHQINNTKLIIAK